MKDRRIMAILVGAIMIMVLGQALSYHTNAFTWNADAELEGNSLSYSINSNYKSKYSAVAFEGAKIQDSPVLIFFDENCGLDAVHWRNIRFDVQSINHELQNRGCKTRIVDSEELAEALEGTRHSKDSLVVTAGILPRSVYDGTASSKIIKWIDEGGSLYWTGKPIGKYIGDENGTTTVSNYSQLFFGVDNAISEKYIKVYDWAPSGIGSHLSLSMNCTLYGLSEDLPGALSFGRSGNGFGTAVAFPKLAGSITVVAHESSNKARYDMAQTVASGITPQTKLLNFDAGYVSGSVNGILNLPPHTGNVTVYIFLGGHLSTYGKNFSF